MPIIPDAFDNWDMIDRQNGIEPGTASNNTKNTVWGSNDWLDEIIQRMNNGDEAATQIYYNYMASESSNKTARDWNAQREDTAYDRLMAQLRRNGISPYILSGSLPSVSQASGTSYTGSQIVSRANNKNTTSTSTNNAILNDFFKILGTVLGAVVMAAMAA